MYINLQKIHSIKNSFVPLPLPLQKSEFERRTNMYINLDRRSTLLKIPSVPLPLQKSEFTISHSLILIRKEGDEYVYQSIEDPLY